MRRIVPILVIIALLAAGGAAYMLTRPEATDTNTTETTPNSTGQQSTGTLGGSESNDNAEAISITYSSGGFSPTNVVIKSGQKVTVINDSGRSLQFSSDPHPVHTANPELNQAVLASGKSQTFAITKSGSWGYHNHLNDSDKGQITVQ